MRLSRHKTRASRARSRLLRLEEGGALLIQNGGGKILREFRGSSLGSRDGDRIVYAPSTNLHNRPVLRGELSALRPVVLVGALRVFGSLPLGGIQIVAHNSQGTTDPAAVYLRSERFLWETFSQLVRSSRAYLSEKRENTRNGRFLYIH